MSTSSDDYEYRIEVPKFAGINQSGDGYGTELKYADSGQNFSIEAGTLRPMKSGQDILVDDETSTYANELVFENGAQTLAFLTKRWTQGASGVIPANSYTNKYCICVVNDKLYYRMPNEYLPGTSYEGSSWIELKDTGNVSFSFTNNKFDTLTYEINYLPPVKWSTDICALVYAGASYCVFDTEDYEYHEIVADSATTAHYVKRDETSVTMTTTMNVREVCDAPVDVLLMTNEDDGMLCVYAPLSVDTLSVCRVTIQPEGTSESIKFGCIERYSERIFGSGTTSDPDKLMYCAPKDFFNWEQYNDSPDDGAGDIQQPDWDGDQIISLKAFGASLICLKQNAIWRLYGTTPSEFSMKKMYGEGTIADGSIAVNGYYMYFLSDSGLKMYDGTSSNYIKYGWLKNLLPAKSGYTTAHALMFNDYYCIMPRNGITGIVMYNTVENTFMYLAADNYTALAVLNNTLYGMRKVESGDNTYAVLANVMSGGSTLPVTWCSAWQDLSAKNIDKSGFVVYLYADGTGTLPVRVTIETDRKTKYKDVVLTLGEPKRVRINNSGRQFRLKLETGENAPAWEMGFGFQIYMEFDYD